MNSPFWETARVYTGTKIQAPKIQADYWGRAQDWKRFLWLTSESSASKIPLADFLLRAFDMPVPSLTDDTNASGQPCCRFTLHDLHSQQLSLIKSVHHTPGSRRRVRRWGETLMTGANVGADRHTHRNHSLIWFVKLQNKPHNWLTISQMPLIFKD